MAGIQCSGTPLMAVFMMCSYSLASCSVSKAAHNSTVTPATTEALHWKLNSAEQYYCTLLTYACMDTRALTPVYKQDAAYRGS